MDTPIPVETLEKAAGDLRVPTSASAAAVALTIYSYASQRPGLFLLGLMLSTVTALGAVTQILAESDKQDISVFRVVGEMGRVTLRDLKRGWNALENPERGGPSS